MASKTIRVRFDGVVKGLVTAAKVAERTVSRFHDRVQKAAGKISVVTAAAAALGPALLPVLAAATAGAVGLGAAFGAAGAAVGVFGAVTASAFAEVKTASDKTAGLRDKIALLNEQINVANRTGIGDAGKLEKAKIRATNELLARYAQLPPATRAVVAQYDAMKIAWQGFVDQNKPAVYGLMTGFFATITASVGKLQPLFDIGAAAAGRALGALQRFAAGGGLDRLVGFLSGQAGPALDSLGTIAKNVGMFFGNLFKGTVDDGQAFLDWLADGSEKLAAWSEKGEGGLGDFLTYVKENGPKVGELLANVGAALSTIAQAAGPLAPVSLAIAGALAAIIAAIPPEVVTALTAAWLAYTVAMAGYNAIMATVSAATKVWTAIQWASNAAWLASPLTWIILGIVALIAVIVLIATKTTWFQTIWEKVWGFLKMVGAWFAGPFANFFVMVWEGIVSGAKWVWDKVSAYFGFWWGLFGKIKGWATSFKDWILKKLGDMVDWIKGLPGRISSAASGMWDGIKNAFRGALNWLIDKWNGLSFTIPSINVPGFGQVGGGTLSTPDIGRLASGGHMTPGRTYLTGENGIEAITAGRTGGYVHSAGDTAAMMGPPDVHVYIGDRELTDLVDVRITTRDRQLKRRAGARTTAAAF